MDVFGENYFSTIATTNFRNLPKLIPKGLKHISKHVPTKSKKSLGRARNHPVPPGPDSGSPHLGEQYLLLPQRECVFLQHKDSLLLPEGEGISVDQTTGLISSQESGFLDISYVSKLDTTGYVFFNFSHGDFCCFRRCVFFSILFLP